MWQSPLLPIIDWFKQLLAYMFFGNYYSYILIPALVMFVVGLIFARMWKFAYIFTIGGVLLLLLPLLILSVGLFIGIFVLIPLELVIMAIDPDAREGLAATIFMAFLCLIPFGGGGGTIVMILFLRR